MCWTVVFKVAFKSYCSQAGLRVNVSKSDFVVGPNTADSERNFISQLFGIRIVDKPGACSGSCLDITEKKGYLFQRVLGRIRAKLAGS